MGQQGHSFKIACYKLLECLNVIGAILLLLLVTINNNWIFFSKYDQITIHLLRKKVKMVGRILQTAKVRHYCATVKKIMKKIFIGGSRGKKRKGHIYSVLHMKVMYETNVGEDAWTKDNTHKLKGTELTFWDKRRQLKVHS